MYAFYTALIGQTKYFSKNLQQRLDLLSAVTSRYAETSRLSRQTDSSLSRVMILVYKNIQGRALPTNNATRGILRAT